MTEQKKVETLENRLIDDKLATQKDLKILELELCRKMENMIYDLKSSLTKSLGAMIIAGFGILGYLVVWFKH